MYLNALDEQSIKRLQKFITINSNLHRTLIFLWTLRGLFMAALIAEHSIAAPSSRRSTVISELTLFSPEARSIGESFDGLQLIKLSEI